MELFNDDGIIIATASLPQQRGRPFWHFTAADVGACLQRPPPLWFPSVPPYLFPCRATPSVKLFPLDSISLADGNALPRRVVNGLFLWFLMKFGRVGGPGGLRLLTSIDADFMEASVRRDGRLVLEGS